jgi:hypothetical protein
VNYQQTKRQLEIHHKGVYLGEQDKVQFYLWGPEVEKDFDDWRIWGEMKIPDGDLGVSFKQMARAALLHGCGRVVLLPNKNKALAVNSESEGLLTSQARILGARLELIKKAASLSLEEYTVPEIAIELKISDSKVRRLLAASEGLPASYLSETAQVARLLDLDRLDGVLSVAFPVAMG